MPASQTIDYEKIVHDVVCALEERQAACAPEPPAGPRREGLHPAHEGPHGRIVPLPAHRRMHERVAFDADALLDALEARGLAAAARALSSAPGEVKIAAALLLDVPVTFAAGAAPRHAPCGFDNPLLAGESLERLARTLGADVERVRAELEGAPLEMTALVMLALGLREPAGLPDAPAPAEGLHAPAPGAAPAYGAPKGPDVPPSVARVPASEPAPAHRVLAGEE